MPKLWYSMYSYTQLKFVLLYSCCIFNIIKVVHLKINSQNSYLLISNKSKITQITYIH